jgi:hypothetical protein
MLCSLNLLDLLNVVEPLKKSHFYLMIYGEKVLQGIKLTLIIERNAITIEFHKAPETLFAVDKYAQGLACILKN